MFGMEIGWEDRNFSRRTDFRQAQVRLAAAAGGMIE
jgi:hypothetical protein